jgi:glyoxylase-like metal-dependent hydrolase (beta-lactamase superfamily II)
MNTSRRTQLTPDIVCLRADNASAMTGAGTNSYVVFGAGGAVVIDPGPDLHSHFDALREAIGPQPLAAIFITHPHADHSALAPRLAAQMGASIASFGAAAPAQSGGEGVDHSHQPDILLHAGQAQFAGMEFAILHTPGHMQGHLCFGYKDILFSGDHVMGWSTSLISPPEGDMAAYRRSLRALQGAGYTRYFCGHGAVIDDPEARLRDLIDHRTAREAQILATLAQGDMSAQHLAAQIYSDLFPALLPAAAQNVLAHLIELAQTGRAQPNTQGHAPSPTTIFSLSPP